MVHLKEVKIVKKKKVEKKEKFFKSFFKVSSMLESLRKTSDRVCSAGLYMTFELSKSCPFNSNNVSCSQKWPSPLRVNTSPLLTCSPISNPLFHSSRLMSLTHPDFAQPDVTSFAFRPPEHSVYTSCTTCLYRYVVSIFST